MCYIFIFLTLKGFGWLWHLYATSTLLHAERSRSRSGLKTLFSLYNTPSSFSTMNSSASIIPFGGKEGVRKIKIHKAISVSLQSACSLLGGRLIVKQITGLIPLGCLPFEEHQAGSICHWCFPRVTGPQMILCPNEQLRDLFSLNDSTQVDHRSTRGRIHTWHSHARQHLNRVYIFRYVWQLTLGLIQIKSN